jgi:hypothetical protein
VLGAGEVMMFVVIFECMGNEERKFKKSGSERGTAQGLLSPTVLRLPILLKFCAWLHWGMLTPAQVNTLHLHNPHNLSPPPESPRIQPRHCGAVTGR